MRQRKKGWRTFAKDVDCPLCGSEAGEPCMDVRSGEPIGRVHSVRAEVARVATGPVLCGTKAGYERHKRFGEPQDDLCRAANAKYQQERRSDADKYARDRVSQRAYQRALSVLVKRHQDEFRSICARLRAEEREAS